MTAPRKALVIELAGLGDNVHLLPALHALRRAWPGTELHVMVNAHVAGLLELTPWVQRVWTYPTAPKPRLAGNWRLGCELARERFDVVFNSNGSDRSSLLTWLTRAPRRIGRRPADGGPFGWSRLFTEVVETPFHAEPMFRQKLRCVQQFGIAVEDADFERPDFGIRIDPALRRAAGVEAADEGGYLHLSPFTTSPARELPLRQLAALIAGLRAAHPQLRIALSCARTPREVDGMQALVALLAEPPWRVWPGTLDVPGLAAVVETCALNLSGDTGSLHVAVMCGAPALAWFRHHRGEREWIPTGPRGRVIIAPGGPADALYGIETGALLDAAAALLRPDS